MGFTSDGRIIQLLIWPSANRLYFVILSQSQWHDRSKIALNAIRLQCTRSTNAASFINFQTVAKSVILTYTIYGAHSILLCFDCFAYFNRFELSVSVDLIHIGA